MKVMKEPSDIPGTTYLRLRVARVAQTGNKGDFSKKTMIECFVEHSKSFFCTKTILIFGFGAVGREEWKRAETCWGTKIINAQTVRWVFVKSSVGEHFDQIFVFENATDQGSQTFLIHRSATLNISRSGDHPPPSTNLKIWRSSTP